MQLPDPSLPWPISLDAVGLIADYEKDPKTGGPWLKAYRCPAGVWTIGWGETDGVRPGDTCTKEEADRWLLEDTTERARRVREACTVEPSDAELGAMVSLSYNIGFGDLKRKIPGFLTSTVLRQHNAGNRQAAARAFGLWNKAKVDGQLQVLNGLTARRAREEALYLQSDDGSSGRMPQAVEAESKLRESPINKGGVAAAGTGVIAVVTQAGESLSSVSDPLRKVKALFLDTMGIPADWFLPLVLIGVGLAVIYWRNKQRKEGWA